MFTSETHTTIFDVLNVTTEEVETSDGAQYRSIEDPSKATMTGNRRHVQVITVYELTL